MVKKDHEIEEECRKSALQITLEKEGWVFLTNALVGKFGEPKTDEHLVFEYMTTHKYKNVLITDAAFDINGKQIDNPDYRAVYVKR